MAARKRSGYAREDQRSTEKVTLRLHPVFAEIIRKVAEPGLHETEGFTMSGMIEHAFAAWCKSSGAASPNDIKRMMAVLNERYGHGATESPSFAHEETKK